MSDTGKQSPLGVNVLATLLQNQGFYINPKVRNLAGQSKTNDQYVLGEIVQNTCLKWLTYALNDGFKRGDPNVSPATGTLTRTTYENLINVGQSRIPALGNSPPPTYVAEDPSGVWKGEATSGYGISGDTGQGQEATWFPFTCGGADPESNNPNISASQWGWLRLIALQAWDEFNYNGEYPEQAVPQYQYFLQSFLSAQGFVDYSNKAIYAINDSKEFLKGVYSNMDDLTSSDLTGVSLASRAFGQDLINLGKAMELSYIASFGLPSNLLRTLKKNNALNADVNYVLTAAGFTNNSLTNIINGTSATLQEEQSLYGAFSLITDSALKTVLQTLNCKTKGLTTLADLLNMRKIFPISYPSLTVPIYNTVPNPTNSKTYYLLFVNGKLNPQLIAPPIAEKVEPECPPESDPEPPPPPEIIPEPPLVTPEEIIVTPPLPPPEPVIPTVPAPARAEPPYKPSGGGGGGCVALESFIPLVEKEKKHNGREITQAWMLENTMKISLGTDALEIVDGSVIGSLNDYQPCVRIRTSDGIALVCSTTARIKTKEGFLPATELYGKRVAVMRNNRTWYDEVVQLEDAGMKFVRVIDAGDNSFWAGEHPGSYILHHNVPMFDNYNYDKK